MPFIEKARPAKLTTSKFEKRKMKLTYV